MSKLLIRSFPLSDRSESLTVAHLSWATWAIPSQLLICLEQSERIAHSRLFDLSEMSEWAMSKWTNSQPCFRFLAFFLFFILFLSTSLTLSFSFSPPTLSEIFVKYLTASTNYCWCDRWKFISWCKYSIKKNILMFIYLITKSSKVSHSVLFLPVTASKLCSEWKAFFVCRRIWSCLGRQQRNIRNFLKINPPQIHPFFRREIRHKSILSCWRENLNKSVLSV